MNDAMLRLEADLLPPHARRLWLDAFKRGGSQTAWDEVRAQGWRWDDERRWVKTDKRLLHERARTAIAMLGLANAVAKASWGKQPRVISGPKGGQWTTHSGGGAVTTLAPQGQGLADRIVAPHLGQGGIAAHRFESDPLNAAFVAPLKQTEITGKPAFLDNPHGYVLMEPSTATPVANNGNPEDVASYIPDGDPGTGLNGIAFKPWDPPEDWSKVAGQGKFDEPPVPDAKGKRLGAGVIIEEPDGRIWTVNPLNQFGGYRETFPKGGIETGLDLRQTAIKEAWEESGLKVELTGYLGDFERTTSVARYYRAKRVTGDPTDAHWETQSVNAVPLTDLADRVVHHADAPIIAALMGENVSVQKALCVLADLIDADDLHAALEGGVVDFALAKAKGKGGGSWKKQMRVPSGLPTGGQWTTYGSGAIGKAYAAGGVALDLQKHMGSGPQSEALNAKIALYQNAANQSYLHPDAMKVLSGPMSDQTYSSAKWQSAAEAKAYVDAGGMDPNVGTSAAAIAPTGHSAKVEAEKVHAAVSAALKPKPAPAPVATAANTAGKTFAEAAAQDIAALTPKPAGQATLASTIAQSTGKKTPLGTLSDPLSLAAMTKVGAKPGGSAAGGIHVDATGQKWLVKSYDTALQAQNEVAASKIYNALGVQTPQMKLVDLGGAYKGGIGVASKYLDDVEPFNVNNPSHVASVQANFGAHALLADWDAVGASFDNVMISKTTGAAVLVDPGGSMLFRAQGTAKGGDFKDTVGELNSMRDPKTNPTAAKVFGPMSESAIGQSALAAGYGLTDHAPDVAKIIDDHMPLAEGTKLKAKLFKRAIDITNQGSQLQANLASSASVGIAKTGTTTATPTHADPHVAAVAALSGSDAQKHIDDLSGQIGDTHLSLTGASTDFYSGKINDLNQIAATGDVAAVHAALYAPKTGTAKLSTNYSTYLKAHALAVKKAEAVAGQNLKSAPEAKAGSMVTGSAKITPAQVTSAKTSGETSKMADPLTPSVALHIEPTPTPKPVTPQVLAPLPTLPKKPFVASTAANPNTKTIGQNDAIEKINNDSGLTPQQKIAQIHAIAQQLPAAGNTYSKKVKQYAADSIAAHGGMHALDTMPQPAKTAALNEGLAKGNEAAGVPKPGAVVETKVEDLGGGFKLTTTTETTTTVNPPIDPHAPFDPAVLPQPPDFHNFYGPGQPLYKSQPEFNAINTAAAQGMFAAAKLGKTELDKIDPGQSNKLIAYKASLLSVIDGHAADLKAKIKAWKPTTVDVKVISQHLTEGSGPPTNPAKATAAMTAGMSHPQNWTATAAQKIGGFVKVGAIDPKLAKHLHDAIPTVQIGTKSPLTKALTKLTSLIPQKYKDALTAHTKGHAWQQKNIALTTTGPSSSYYAAAIETAKDINAGIYDLPVGLTTLRHMGFSTPAMSTPDFWNNLAGTVMNHPGIASTSIDGAWSGSTLFKIKMTEGVKGAYVGATAGIKVGTENELVLPRNTKWVVVGAQSYSDAIKSDDFIKDAKEMREADGHSFYGASVVVEVMAVPHDAPE